MSISPSDYAQLQAEVFELKQQVRTLETQLTDTHQHLNMLRLEGINHAISNLIESEQHQKLTDRRLKAILDLMPDRAVILDQEGTYLEVLKEGYASTSASYPQDVLGKTFHDIYPEDFADFGMTVIGKTIETGKHHVFNYEYKTETGAIDYMEGRLSPIQDLATGDTHVIWISRDVTPRVQDQARLKYLNQFQTLMISLATEFINMPTDILDEYVQKLLQKVAEFIGADRSYINHFSEDLTVATRDYEWCADSVPTRKDNTFDLTTGEYDWQLNHYKENRPILINQLDQIPDLVERERWHKLSSVQGAVSIPLFEDKQLIGSIGFSKITSQTNWSEDTLNLLEFVAQIYLNVVARKNAEDSRHETEEKLNAVIEALPDRAVVLSPDGYYVDVIKKRQDTSMYQPPDDVIGKHLSQVQRKEFTDFCMAQIQRTLETGKRQHFEYSAINKLDKLVYFDGYISPYKNSETGETNILWISRDISKLKQTEGDLRLAMTYQELLTSLATDFINLKSDEMKAKINDALIKIRQVTQADECFIGIYSDDYTYVERMYNWGTFRVSGWWPEVKQSFKWMLAQFKMGKVIAEDVVNLPDGAQVEKQILQSREIKSLIEVPLFVNDKLIGFVGITASKIGILKPETMITPLQVVGKIFSSALESQQVEIALQDSEMRYRNLLDKAPVAFLVWQQSGDDVICVYANTAATTVYGRTEAELIGQSVMAIVPVDVQPKARERLNRLLSGDDPGVFETYTQRPDGTIAYILVSSILISHEDHAAVLSVTIDISNRKLAESTLQQREMMLKQAEQVGRIGSWEQSLTTDDATWSDEFYRICGLDPDAVVPGIDASIAVTHPDDRATAQEAIHRLNEEGVPYAFERRIVRPDGEIRWVESRAEVIWDDLTQSRKSLGIFLDITERKHMENRLRQSEKHLRLVSSVTSDYTFSSKVNEDGSLEHMLLTGAFERITGYTDQEYLEQGGWRALIHPEDRAIDDTGFKKLQQNERISVELRTITKNNDIRWVNVFAYPVWDIAENRLIAIEGAVKDITARKKAELELQKHRDHLEDLVAQRTSDLQEAVAVSNAIAHALEDSLHEVADINQELEAFTYTVSHDLRAPLRALNNYSQFLQEDCADGLDEDCLEYVQGIAESAQQMENLVVDLLDYSRINRVEVLVTPVDIGQLIRDLDKQLTLSPQCSIKLADDLPTITAKRTRLEQIFSNLLTNARKFQQRDTDPVITVDWHQDDDFWYFSVADNGIGIQDKHLDRIFGIFQRLHTQEEYDGTGIGLAIVDKAVKEHHGKVTVQSEEGAGSHFTFSISKHLT